MTVTSSQNAKVKWVRALLRRADERQRSGLCVIEGMHLACAAAQNGIPFELVVVCPERLDRRPAALGFVERMRAAGTALLEVTPDVFDSLAVRENAQGVLGVVRQRWESLEDLKVHPPGFFVALDGVQYPGNLGTILRTADAAGCHGVLLLDRATDPYDPLSLRASRGAVFSQSLVRVRSEAFLKWREQQGISLIGATPSGPQDYRTATYPLPLCLLLGGERAGISPALEAACALRVRIPMAGQCDSLNLAVSAGVLMYAIRAQHHPPG